MRAFLVATFVAGAIGLCGTPLSAAPDTGTFPATMIQPVQYGGPNGGDYPWYRRSCNFGYHYTCVYEYSGYRRCGCQADTLYTPNPYYGFGPSFHGVPAPGYDSY